MNILFLIQFTWCVVSVMLAMMLVASRCQMRWINHRYETSRRLLVGAMLLLAVHFYLQMSQGFRAKSDELGTVVNLLFYTPVVFLISYATYHVVCYREGRRRYITVGISSYAALLAAFFVGIARSGGLHPGLMLYVMLLCFVVCMLYCIAANIREIRHHRKIMEEETAVDMLPYDRYTWASYAIVCVSITMLTATILYRPLLLIIAPLMLVSLLIFTMNFIGYGYNILPIDMEEDENSDNGNTEDENTEEGAGEESEAVSVSSQETLSSAVDKSELADGRTDLPALSAERVETIERALGQWCSAGGFRDSAVTLPLLSKKLRISKVELTLYFERHLKSTFRVWLSDIRFAEVQRMILENPHYSNDMISAECGFSSHAHLYKIFKAKTGMTPRQWKESLAAEES